ncbi:MAG: dihydrofolate reductase [Bacteroidales bacterium]|nr:dihydrofolate reductase [Bacteroidales bacterium]
MIDHTPTPQPNLSAIVAIADDYAIGRDNDLIWHISADLKRFKALTLEHSVIMGRNTWNGLPKKPLPKRRNIVVTHDLDFHPDGAEVAHSIAEAIQLTRDEQEVFVMGGAALYQQLMPYVQRLYVTHVYASFPDADVHFPEIDPSSFRKVAETEKVLDEASQLTYNYIDYQRINNH